MGVAQDPIMGDMAWKTHGNGSSCPAALIINTPRTEPGAELKKGQAAPWQKQGEIEAFPKFQAPPGPIAVCMLMSWGLSQLSQPSCRLEMVFHTISAQEP